MIRRAGICTVLLSAVVGLALGILAPASPVSASVVTSINYYARVDHASSQNTCGWHTDCAGGANYERGLDFVSNLYPSTAMFNAWAVSGDVTPTARGHAIIGNAKPPGQSICPATSVTIYDSSWNQQVTIYAMHSSPGSYNGTSFPIYANNLSYGGYWNSRAIGAYDGSTCGGAVHIMSWMGGLVPGVINIITHDPWPSYCPQLGPGFHSPYYYPCYDGGQWSTSHDLNDWTYASSWSTPS